MQRLRLRDCRLSRLPEVVGSCSSDIPRIAGFVNTAQRRLIYAKEAGDEGWWGTWAEIAFSVSQATPYITLDRHVARLEAVDICDRPVPIQNQFFEYLRFGNGRMPKQFFACHHRNFLQTFSRNNAVTFTAMTNPPQILAVYFSDPGDAGKRVLIQGLDKNNSVIYSQDGFNQVSGIFLALASPFVTTPMQFNVITGIQKDITNGNVQIFQMDPKTGAQILLLTMEPSEQTAWYRRYFLDPLPLNCCMTNFSSSACQPPLPQGAPATVQVTAIAKLELIPAVVDTDYCLLQNLEAIIEESASTRYSEMDTPGAKSMAAERHTQAIRMLNGELTHYLGRDEPAVEFRPFGSAKLEHQRIGTLI